MSAELKDDVRELWRQVERAQADAEALVAGLDAAQLAWTPAPGRWGIADNLEHLAAVDRWYLKQIDRALDDARARGLGRGGAARLSVLERLAVVLTEPPVRRLRVRAPQGFGPAEGRDAAAVAAAYREHLAAFYERLRRCDSVDLARARVRTPLSRRFKVSLFGCWSFLLAHERRHLWQARQVREDAAFPAG